MPSKTRRMTMSGLDSLIGTRYRLGTSVWVGAIGLSLPVGAANATTTSPAPSGIEIATQVPFSSNPGAAIAQAPVLGAAATPPAVEDTSIRPFQIHVSDEALEDLRRRVAEAKW